MLPPMTSWPASRRLADIGVRLAYLGAAIAMTWVLALRQRAVAEAYSASFEFPLARWLLFIGAGVLIGVLIGLALRAPTAWGGYRVGVALVLGIPPALLLGTVPAYVTGRWVPPSWITTLTAGSGQAVLAVMVGLAITAGLTSRVADPPPEDRDRPSAPGG